MSDRCRIDEHCDCCGDKRLTREVHLLFPSGYGGHVTQPVLACHECACRQLYLIGLKLTPEQLCELRRQLMTARIDAEDSYTGGE